MEKVGFYEVLNYTCEKHGAVPHQTVGGKSECIKCCQERLDQMLSVSGCINLQEPEMKRVLKAIFIGVGDSINIGEDEIIVSCAPDKNGLGFIVLVEKKHG